MGTTTSKPTEVLDAMLEHVRYEGGRKAVNFLPTRKRMVRAALPSDLAPFASESILEAGLVHFRCLIEFRGNKPEETGDGARLREGMGLDYLRWAREGWRTSRPRCASRDNPGTSQRRWRLRLVEVAQRARKDGARCAATSSSPSQANPTRFPALDRGDLLGAIDVLLGA
ncbi:MAG: hypothetical protein U0Q03_20510 [Acidimicrobiales bacterium]